MEAAAGLGCESDPRHVAGRHDIEEERAVDAHATDERVDDRVARTRRVRDEDDALVFARGDAFERIDDAVVGTNAVMDDAPDVDEEVVEAIDERS